MSFHSLMPQPLRRRRVKAARHDGRMTKQAIIQCFLGILVGVRQNGLTDQVASGSSPAGTSAPPARGQLRRLRQAPAPLLA